MNSMFATERSRRVGFKDGRELMLVTCPAIAHRPFDLFLKCNQKIFVANKDYLCKRCPVLRKFAKQTKDGWEIYLESSDDTIEALLFYLYFQQAEIFKDKSDEQLFSLLEASGSLQMKDAETAIWTELMSINRSSNFVSFIWDLQAAKKSKKNRVQREATCLLKHLDYLCTSNIFIRLRRNVVELILKKSVNRPVPVCLLTKALLNWVKWDAKRHTIIPLIARYTKWSHFDAVDLRYLLLTEPLLQKIVLLAAKQRNCVLPVQTPVTVSDSGDVKAMENVHVKKTPPSLSSDELQETDESCCGDYKSGIFVMGTKNDEIVIYIITADGKCTRGVKVDIPFRHVSQPAYFRGQLYMITEHYKCITYDLATNTPSELKGMVEPRICAGVVVVDNYLYVIAGLGESNVPTNRCERLYLATRKSPGDWEQLQPLSYPRWCPAVAVGDSKQIFVIGGHTRKCECYDKKTGKWCKLLSLPHGYGNCALLATFHNGRLYCLQQDEPQEICILNPAANFVEVIVASEQFPTIVRSMFKFLSNIWILGESGQFFMLDELDFIWMPMLRLKISAPTSTIWSAVNINLDELTTHVCHCSKTVQSARLPKSPITPNLMMSLSEPSLRLHDHRQSAKTLGLPPYQPPKPRKKPKHSNWSNRRYFSKASLCPDEIDGVVIDDCPIRPRFAHGYAPL